MDCSPPGSLVLGILQERILKWVDIPFSMGSFQPRDGTWVFYVSFIGRFFFFFNHQCQLGSPYNGILCNKTEWTIYCCMLQIILILKSTLLNKLDKMSKYDINSLLWLLSFPSGSVVKNPARQEPQRMLVLFLGQENHLHATGGRHGNTLQHSCLGNPMDNRDMS